MGRDHAAGRRVAAADFGVRGMKLLDQSKRSAALCVRRPRSAVVGAQSDQLNMPQQIVSKVAQADS